MKDIRDGLANGVIRPNNMPNRPNDDDRPDRPDDRPDRSDGALGSAFLNNLNTNINNIQRNGEHYARLITNQNANIKKLEVEIKDKKNLTKDIMDQAGETINNIKEESSEILFEYTEALKQLNSANNIYGRNIGTLSTDLNNERTRANELLNKIEDLEKTNELSSKTLVDLSEKLRKLKNNKNKLKEDNKYLNNLVNNLRDNNSELIQNIKNINNEGTGDQAKIRDMLN